MIPSLNLGKVKGCAPAPLLATSTPRQTVSTPPMVHSSVSKAEQDSSSCPSTDRRCSAAVGHEVSALRSGAVDASDFLGIDIDHETDIEVLRHRLREAKGILVALDAWYAARLAEKEQIMAHRLSQLAAACTDGSLHRGGYLAPTVGSSSRAATPQSVRRPATSPRSAYRQMTPDRAPSPRAGGLNMSQSSSYATSATGRAKSPPVGAAVHPRPFNSNAGVRRSIPQSSGYAYVPPTGTSPRSVASYSGQPSGVTRIPSTPGTPMSTPRAMLSSRTTGHSPIDAHDRSNAPLSARSVGGGSSARRAHLHNVVNWSSSIPTGSSGDGLHTSFGHVTRYGAAADSSMLHADRRAHTPRY